MDDNNKLRIVEDVK